MRMKGNIMVRPGMPRAYPPRAGWVVTHPWLAGGSVIPFV